MTKEQLYELAKKLRWKPIGKPHTTQSGNDSKYQCFRRGNHYTWIGNYFVERDTETMAHDYINSAPEDTRQFLL